MKVSVTAHGTLRRHFGEGTHIVELRDGATVGDLLLRIEELWGGAIPGHLWNAGKHRFRGPVVLTVGGKAVHDIERILSENDHIGIYKALVGG